MSDIEDLFDDDDEQQEQQEPQQEFADSPPAQQQQQDDAQGLEDLEDDMGDEQPDEADLFGSPARSDDEAAAEPAADEPTGEPITVSAPLLQRCVVQTQQG